jgi:hypothetical protein
MIVALTRVTQSQKAKINCRRIALVTFAFLVYLAILQMTGSALRNNDQAAYLSGAVQLSQFQISPWHADLYNYDKQYGTYWLLATALWLFPKSDPILTGNIVQVFLFGLALAATVLRLLRASTPSLAFLTPVLLCPALVLSMPFLGTSTISFAFLLLAFSSMGYPHTRIGRGTSCFLVALSVMCRADAVLTLPALILTHVPRTRFFDLFKRPFSWAIVVSAALPIVIGIYLAGNQNFSAGLVLNPKIWIGFVVFGLGIAAFLLILILVVGYLRTSWSKKHWFTFYTLTALSLVLPLAFYWFQLRSLQFFLPAVAALLFVLCSRRTTPILQGMYRKSMWPYEAALAVLVIIPWVIGLDAPSLSRIRPTLAQATEFPAAKGHWPMGAYLSYLFNVREKDFILDHNQKIWLAAKTVDFQPCGTVVPLLNTPMVNYLEFAVRLQGKRPILVQSLEQSPCGQVYTDARSVMRYDRLSSNTATFELLDKNITIVSNDNQNGQLILRADRTSGSSNTGPVLSQLRTHFDAREIEIYILLSTVHEIDIQSRLPFEYAVFAEPKSSCNLESRELAAVRNDTILFTWSSTDLRGPVHVHAVCLFPNLVGWAKTVLPRYMSDQ